MSTGIKIQDWQDVYGLFIFLNNYVMFDKIWCDPVKSHQTSLDMDDANWQDYYHSRKVQQTTEM